MFPYSQGMPSPEEVTYGIDLAGLDPAGLNRALAESALQVARQPATLARELAELASAHASVARDVVVHLLGADVDGTPADRRFSDRAWSDNPFLRGIQESYLASAAWAERVLESAEVSEPTRGKAKFALRVLLDAAAPTNIPWLNPSVLKEAVDTGGLSVLRGMRNFAQDALENRGLPRAVDSAPFELGRDLATTPGRVVFRNHVFELIAYEPQTQEVYAHPILYSPSWINKYYVLDLAPGRSFVEYAVSQGHTVFAMSYRNPDESMAEHTFDNHLRDGLLTALDQVSTIIGAAQVDLVGVCIGGTMTMIALAVLAARGEQGRVGSATLLNTLVDYGDPGEIGAFTDERTIERIEKRMQKRGYLDAPDLAGPFTWMRANDLVWRYVVSNWYQGKQPPAFDILAWNADSTRLPAAMHAQFLRTCYLENKLPRPGAFTIDGTPVDLTKVTTPLYVLASETDHIAPWRGAQRTTELVAGPSRFVLASSGHIAGMVSPLGDPKSCYRVGVDGEIQRGSWWEDWAEWASDRSGERVAPPELPPGEPAPGTYVRG